MDLMDLLKDKVQGQVRPGLDRIRLAWEELGSPSRDVPSVLVAGTNGKGSVCGYLARLIGEGFGLYTSPHLNSFTERFVTSSGPSTDQEIALILTEIRERLRPSTFDSLSFFEISTLVALIFFERKKTRINILEVGLGGRLDATNIVEPVASVIVSLALDHVEILGPTLEDIAREKLGICRAGIPLFSAVTGPMATFIQSHAVASRVIFLEELPRVDLQLLPPYQERNLRLAAGVYQFLREKFVPWNVDESWETSLARTAQPIGGSLRGRFERITDEDGRLFLVDVCHNPAGAEALCEGLRAGGYPKVPGLVCGLRDKDMEGMIRVLSSCLEPLGLAAFAHPRGFDSHNLQQTFPNALRFSSIEEGVRWLRSFDAPIRVFAGSVAAGGYCLKVLADTPSFSSE